MPPLLLHLRVPTGTGFIGLWLPYFLIYPLLLAVMVILAPFVFIAVLFTWDSGYGRTILLSGPYLWRLLWRLKGLKIDIDSPRRKLLMSFV